MRKLKIFGGWMLGFVLLLLLSAHLLLQYRAKQVLQRVVEDLSNSHYTTSASKVEVSYFPVGISLQQFALQPTRADRQLLSFTADSIDLQIGSIWALLLQKKLDVQVIHLHKPSLVAYAHHRANADSTRKPVAQTLAAIQQKLFQAFTALDVRDASIIDAAIKIINAEDETKYFSINHVTLSMLGFDISPDGSKPDKPVFQYGNITLTHPDIHLEDSSLQVQLGKLVVDGIKGDVEIDSIDIAYQTPQEATEKIKLNSIDIRNFNWPRFLQEGFFEVDSILIDKGEATLDLTKSSSKKDRSQKSTKYAGSSFLVHHAAISNVIYVFTTKDYVEKDDVSVMRLQGDELAVDELSIIKDRNPVLDVGSLNIHISNFTETDTSSLYSASMSDLAIQSDALILRNYQITERKTESGKANTITVPELRLEGYSLSDLLLSKLIANKLTVVEPQILLHVLSNKKNASNSNADINKRVDEMLRKIEEKIQLNDIVVHKASISLIPQETPNQAIKLLGLSLSIDGKKIVKASNVMEIIHAIDELQTKGFTLTGNNIFLKVSDAKLLNNPRGFYFGSIKGQFGEDAQIDLRGVTLLNADNNIDLTSQEGLHPSHLSVESGSVTILQKNKVDRSGKSHPLPTLRIGQLDLSNMVLKMQQEDKLAASSAFDLHARGFVFDEGIASWTTLQFGSRQNELESGNTFFKAGSMQLEQPGILRIKNARGSNKANQTAIDFSIEEMEAGFGISNSQPDELRIVSLQLTNPTLRIHSTKSTSTIAASNQKDSSNSKPFFLDHLNITNPNIDFVMKDASGDTLHYSNTVLGQLQCENVSVTQQYAQPLIQVGSIRYYSQQLKAAFAEKLFNPSSLLLVLSNIEMQPSKKLVQCHIDTVALTDIAHTLIGKKQDTTDIRIGSMGLSDYDFLSTDSIDWKQLLQQRHWWMSSASIAHRNATQYITVHGLSATHDKNIRFTLDSMQMNSRMNRANFWLHEPYEKDYISVSTGRITGQQVVLDFSQELPPIRIAKLAVDKALLWPQRDKTRPEDTVSYRPLLAQQISQIPIPLQIDSVLLSNCQLRYNEIGQKTAKEGKIFIDNINGFVANVKTHNIQPNDSLIMIINSRLYGKGPTRVNFRQSYTDSLQGFWMRVRMGAMNMQEMNAFLRPQMGLQIKSGFIDTLTLLVNGNKYFAYGTMDLRYRKMSVRLLGKDGDGKYFLAGTINWLANQVLRRHDNGRPNMVFKNRVVKRGQFNFLSKIGVEGLLTNIGIKTDRKERKKFKKNLHKYNLPPNYWGNDDL